MAESRPKEQPLGSILGEPVGPVIEFLELKGRVFRNVPVVWQDWTFYQQAAAENRYGTTQKFESYWLGLDDDVSIEDTSEDQANALVARAQKLNQGVSKLEKSEANRPDLTRVFKAMLGRDTPPAEDQAFYLYVLLAPYEDGLEEEDLLKGSRGWKLTLEWIMAHVSQFQMQSILLQCLRIQYEATLGILEEAMKGEAQGKELESEPSSGVG